MRYTKYQIAKADNGYVIKIKPTWKRGRIFDSTTLGKFHDTYEEANSVLVRLYDRFKREYDLEWKDEAKRENSILESIIYKKWKRKKAQQLGVNEVLVDGKYIDEYKRVKGFVE